MIKNAHKNKKWNSFFQKFVWFKLFGKDWIDGRDYYY